MGHSGIAVVTSGWGGYSRYLPGWAWSVAAQTVRPDEVVIVDCGFDDWGQVQTATRILAEAGIAFAVRQSMYLGYGAARNAAVEVTSAEWVMHLNVDDRLFSWAIADTLALTAAADVVSLGALHRGEARCFPRVSAQRILDEELGCFSCAAFRRELWERRPWHTYNDWVDSTFWVGLAHLGARFAGSDRPQFLYQDHPDSTSHRLTHIDRLLAARQLRAACAQWTLT